MPSTRLGPLRASTGVIDFQDAMTWLVLSRFLAGDEPFGCTFDLEGVADPYALVPLAEIERVSEESSRLRVLARVAECSVLAERHASGFTYVTIAGPTTEAVAKAAASVRANAPAPQEASGVLVEFWCGKPDGQVQKMARRIDAPAWADVAGNYPGSVAASLSALMALERPQGQGRLVLWHGPPGTGKTTAARALSRAWHHWCRSMVVVDADELFGRGSYLSSLLLASESSEDDASDGEPDSARWRLLVIEDADELLRADAKRSSGQAMARLLNLADGFLGQGLELLVLLSTNEPVGRLHPAVTRPGRCLAEVAFRPFSPSEAAAWLGAAAGAAGGAEATLAELFHRRGDVARIGGSGPTPSVGMYL